MVHPGSKSRCPPRKCSTSTLSLEKYPPSTVYVSPSPSPSLSLPLSILISCLSVLHFHLLLSQSSSPSTSLCHATRSVLLLCFHIFVSPHYCVFFVGSPRYILYLFLSLRLSLPFWSFMCIPLTISIFYLSLSLMKVRKLSLGHKKLDTDSSQSTFEE